MSSSGAIDDVELRNCRILGACNPPFAYKALPAVERIGVMLFCNVIVQEMADGSVDVAAIDPPSTMQGIHRLGVADNKAVL
jgi:uncharacterized protein (DUF302 family)